MTLHVFQKTLQDEQGNVLPSATVTVRDQVTSNLVQLYSDYDGASPIGNPIAADADGFARLYADVGRYQITATSGAFTRVWENVLLGLPSASIKYNRTPAEIAASVTPVNYQYDELDPLRYSNTLNHTAVQIAINVAAQKPGGARVPIREAFAFTSAVAMAQNVFVEGWGGSITCNACGAFTFGFYTGSGNHGIIGALLINGVGCETQIAIDQPGSGSDADQCYGIVIDGPTVQNFNKCIRLRTAWFHRIHNFTATHVNSGIDAAGYNLVGSLQNIKLVKGSGCGTGASYGYFYGYATYTNGGSHVRSPEGIYGSGTVEAFGFDIAMHLDAVTGLDISGVDLLGFVNAIKFSSLAGIVRLSGYFSVSGAAATACIDGAEQSVVSDTANTKFIGACVGTETVSCAGLRLHPLTAHVDVDLEFSGFTTYDVQLESCGNINILAGSKCHSALTTSIRISSTLAGRQIIVHDGVFCEGRVDVPFADTHAAQVIIGALTGTYSTLVRGVATISNPDTSITVSYDSLLDTGNIPDFAATSNTGMELDLICGTPSANVGAVWGSADVDEVTITVATTPATSAKIPFDVRVRQRYS